MNNIFTAEEARKLSGPTLEEKVNEIFIAIRQAAEKKKRELKAGWDYKDYPELWIDGGYSSTPDWLKAKNILEKAGYNVSFYYDDGSYFVNMFTLIKW